MTAARAHVRVCEGCADYLEQDRALLDLYERARSVCAPRSTRERVFDALAGARWGALQSPVRAGTGTGVRDAGFTSWVRRSTLPGAVLVVLTAAAIWQLSAVREPVREESAVFVEDYLRRAVGQDHIETTDPEEVTRFLERELGLRFLPIQLAGLELSRAEICLLEGRRGAMIVYKKDGAEVAHYLVPRDDSPRRDPALSTKGRPDSDAMPVVTWATPNLEQALVGQLDAEDLLRIAWRGRS